MAELKRRADKDMFPGVTRGAWGRDYCDSCRWGECGIFHVPSPAAAERTRSRRRRSGTRRNKRIARRHRVKFGWPQYVR